MQELFDKSCMQEKRRTNETSSLRISPVTRQLFLELFYLCKPVHLDKTRSRRPTPHVAHELRQRNLTIESKRGRFDFAERKIDRAVTIEQQLPLGKPTALDRHTIEMMESLFEVGRVEDRITI